MPAVSASAKILVTGASGLLATHVIRTLLSQGSEVVGTVRTPAKGDYLVNLFSSNKFSYTIVENIDAANAFDTIVAAGNFDGIVHVASPFNMRLSEVSDFMDPAIRGTTNILQSALNLGPTVKRVVITSSAAAILEPHPAPYTYTESDWNEASIRAVEENRASLGEIYSASKTPAERAAWKFVEEHKSEMAFDLTVICPVWIMGPIIHHVTTPDSLNASHALFWGILKSKQEDLTPEITGASQGYVADVRDMALAHVRALSVEEAGGKRFLAADAPWSNQDVYDVLNEAGVANIPKGHPGSQLREITLQDNTQSVRLLGLEFRGRRDVIMSTYNTLKEHFPSEL
ncbi:NAD(P)-binding protein [Clavulina sp. PMI_390]|nr:NAD(P)-binding protein [Clavulina sp. PMI_390]